MVLFATARGVDMAHGFTRVTVSSLRCRLLFGGLVGRILFSLILLNPNGRHARFCATNNLTA